MTANRHTGISNFYVAGINYKKTDAATRGMFAVSSAHYEHILNVAESCGVGSLFILSTCNRTEIYGFADDAVQLINLLCTKTQGDASTFAQLAYLKKGQEAIEHLY